MNEERKKILKMLEEGRIDVKEAEELLSTLDEKDESTSKVISGEKGTDRASFLKIYVTENGKEQVNISIPIQLVKLLKKLIPGSAKDKLSEEGIDIEELMTQVEERTFDGKLVDIEDGNTHVEIKMVK